VSAFASQTDLYPSLSLRDLLLARDRYHAQLSELPNVVSTAVGRYRIRKGDWYETNPPWIKRPPGYPRTEGARTFANSIITRWSWPAVLVFVRVWEEPSTFKDRASEMVPQTLFLPDGRGVPTCVIWLEQVPANDFQAPQFNFPDSFVGGGFLVESLREGRFRFGSIGCLVTDGCRTFALTNRHVAGEPGAEILAQLGGKRTRVGVAAATNLGKKPLDTVYAGYPATDTILNLDAGLIEIDNIDRWTTQVYGLGELGEPVNLSATNLSLQAIDQAVVAFGGASGRLAGRIVGLFYRYKSMGGVDYVTDVVIGTDEGQRSTLPGDSGTLWCWEEPPAKEESAAGEPDTQATENQEQPKDSRLVRRPLAVQWGGHAFEEASGQWRKYRSLALASFVSTVCRELDIDIVRGWNTGLPEYWGARGHYSVAYHATFVVRGKLGELIEANRANISKDEKRLLSGDSIQDDPNDFVPLTNVPDEVWKFSPKQVKGGRPNRDNPMHYADVDQPYPQDHKWAGKTLLEVILADKRRLTPQIFWDYYRLTSAPNKGSLPFRVWQIFDAAVEARQAQDWVRFVGACGILGHYVGDASQPLHGSFLADGYPIKDKKEKRGAGVHSGYEKTMIDRNRQTLHDGVNAKLANEHATGGVATGKAAAFEIIKLMAESQDEIPPSEIVDAYLEDKSSSALWKALGDRTVGRIAAASRLLARLWTSAWEAGGGDADVPQTALIDVTQQALSDLYRDDNPEFLPSMPLRELAEELGFPPIQDA
jgi:hypothetical protein